MACGVCRRMLGENYSRSMCDLRQGREPTRNANKGTHPLLPGRPGHYRRHYHPLRIRWHRICRPMNSPVELRESTEDRFEMTNKKTTEVLMALLVVTGMVSCGDPALLPLLDT